jgi:hypothetical protein
MTAKIRNWTGTTSASDTSDIFWGVNITEEEDDHMFDYEDLVGIAHQIMAMELGYV